jgi:hypothetical protein
MPAVKETLVETATRAVGLVKWEAPNDKDAVTHTITECRRASEDLAAMDLTEPGAPSAVTTLGARVAGLRTGMAKLKDTIMRPINDRRNSILACFNAVDSALEDVERDAAGKVRELRRIEEERRRLAAQLDTDHDEAQRLYAVHVAELAEAKERERFAAAAALEMEGKPEAAQDALREAEAATPSFTSPQLAAAFLAAPLAPAAPSTPVAGFVTDGAKAGIADKWNYEVVDAWAVPRKLCKPPEVRRRETLAFINALTLVNADKPPEVAGLRVFPVEDVDFRKTKG